MSKNHPQWEDLVDFCEKGDEAMPPHVREGCAECDEKISAIRRLLASLEGNRLAKAPGDLRTRAEEKILHLIGKDQVERLLAEVIFDSSADLNLAGRERDAALDERRLVFRAGEREILLTIRCDSPGSGEMSGQVILADKVSNDLAHIPVLLTGGGGTRSEQTDDLGGFRFTGLGGGIYSLTIQLSATEIAVEGIEIQFS